jgi:hypothetical protein
MNCMTFPLEGFSLAMDPGSNTRIRVEQNGDESLLSLLPELKNISMVVSRSWRYGLLSLAAPQLHMNLRSDICVRSILPPHEPVEYSCSEV